MRFNWFVIFNEEQYCGGGSFQRNSAYKLGGWSSAPFNQTMPEQSGTMFINFIIQFWSQYSKLNEIQHLTWRFYFLFILISSWQPEKDVVIRLQLNNGYFTNSKQTSVPYFDFLKQFKYICNIAVVQSLSVENMYDIITTEPFQEKYISFYIYLKWCREHQILMKRAE